MPSKSPLHTRISGSSAVSGCGCASAAPASSNEIMQRRRKLMKRTILAATFLVPALALAQPKGTVVMDQIEAYVTVTKVDPKARTVTVRGPRGNLQALAVPKESQNLDRVKPGDRFKITYAEAAVIALTRGGEPEVSVQESVSVAPK